MIKSLSLLALFVTLVSPVPTAAQERTRETGVYAVKDHSSGVTGVETWHVEGIVDPEFDPEYTTRRVYTQPPYWPSITYQNENYERRIITRGDVDYRLTWGAHPSMMRDGDRTFGLAFIKNKKLPDTEKRYPVFYEVNQVGTLLFRLTTRIFLEGGVILLTEEIYTLTSYHLPLEIKQRTVNVLGVVTEEITYQRRR